MFEFRLINSFFLSIPESPVPEDITATVTASVTVQKSSVNKLKLKLKLLFV